MQGLERSRPSGPTDRYREIFSLVNSGIAVYRAVDGGENFVFADLNPAAQSIDRIGWAEVRDRLVTDAFPGVAEFGLLDVLRRVWRTGIPETLPLSLYSDGRIAGWRENRVFRLPSGEVAAIYDDRTREMTIEAAQARHARLEAELTYRLDTRRDAVEATAKAPRAVQGLTSPDELRRLNLEHFRQVLERTSDPVERFRIEAMIEEEQAKPDSAYPAALGLQT
ncbi:MAG: hypothetical protein KGO51_10580 [Alphaproteobacteria bacterium]|nr:hypothetical protein [Alphaproteobacteria bacterium]